MIYGAHIIHHTAHSMLPELLWWTHQAVQGQDGVEAQQRHLCGWAAVFRVGPAVFGSPYGRGRRGQIRICIDGALDGFGGVGGEAVAAH